MKNTIILGLIICCFTSCLEKINPASLTNTKWELSELTGKKLPISAKATLNFGDSLKVTGKSFCNNYGGEAEIVDDKVIVKNVYGTRMMCQGTDSEERAFLNALKETDHAKMTDGKLQLLKGEQTLLVFTKVN
ncbi:META domain-containing protein [Pedobacter lithocola]|uniref:META domain-containing protein n=1 Tax=Pedobacter lithocola TaxID=1908239 RepID=A0ABV8PF55_9SPHI